MLNRSTTSTRTALLTDIHNFVSETGMSEDALGRRAINDGRLVPDLRTGRSIGIDTMDRLKNYMAAERARRAEPGGRGAMGSEDPETAPAPGLWARLRVALAGWLA